MSDDLRTQLHAAAGTPSRPVDPDRIHTLRRRWQRRRMAAGTASVVAVVAIAAAVWELPGESGPVIDDPPPPSPTSTPSPDASPTPDASLPSREPAADEPVPMPSQPWPGDPSQSDADAARDGVIDEIAALPAGERIGVIDAAVTAEGIWVTSHIPSPNPDPGRTFGDPDGVYGRDFVTAHGYGELLLLDPTSLAIRRAWPLPGMPPNGTNENDRLQVTDRAVYFAHQGDGGLPNTYLMRVDRDTLEPLVRIVQYDPGTPSDLHYPYWSRAPEPSDVNIQNGMVASDQVVATIGYEGTVVTYDPVTLETTGQSQPDDDVAPGPRGTLLAMAPGTPVRYLEPRDLSPASLDLPGPDVSGSVLDIVESPDRVAMLMASPDGYRVATWTPTSGRWDTVALPGPGMGQRTPRPRLGDVADQVVVLHADVIYTFTATPEPSMRSVAALDRNQSDPMATPGAVVAAPDGTGMLLLGQGRYWTIPMPGD